MLTPLSIVHPGRADGVVGLAFMAGLASIEGDEGLFEVFVVQANKPALLLVTNASLVIAVVRYTERYIVKRNWSCRSFTLRKKLRGWVYENSNSHIITNVQCQLGVRLV